MIHEFQSKTYLTSREMHEAIAFEWLSAGGLSDADFRHQYLGDHSDADLAEDAIYGLGKGDNPQWAEDRGFLREALIDAFTEVRRKILEQST